MHRYETSTINGRDAIVAIVAGSSAGSSPVPQRTGKHFTLPRRKTVCSAYKVIGDSKQPAPVSDHCRLQHHPSPFVQSKVPETILHVPPSVSRSSRESLIAGPD
jgi:hypothetical protein